ncbi:MAG TPA: hypothetical protein PKA64_18815, partial [Myxococcota bacterium]|nr:hypothetical protein [Myxococcota bacterium]
MRGWFLGWALWAGCDPAPDVGTCRGQTLSDSEPSDGARDVFFRDPITVRLGSPDPDASLRLVGPEGEVAGVSSVDGATVSFRATEGLSPSTSYVATWSSCGDEGEIGFTTGELGAPVDDVSGLVSGTWHLDLTSGSIVSPAGLGDTLDTLLGGYPILVSVLAIGPAESVDLRVALGVFDQRLVAQDRCSITLELPDVTFEDPYFSRDADSFGMTWEGTPFTLTSFHVSGAFTADGEEIGGVAVSGQLDTRPLIPVFNDDPSVGPDQMCVFIAPFQVDCVACADGSGPYCVDLSLSDLRAERVDAPIEPRSYDEIALDPA